MKQEGFIRSSIITEIIDKDAMKVPDFFIVGAPKCGTTSLSMWLHEHPQICMGPGETHFFSVDLNVRRAVSTWTQYEKKFEICIGKKQVLQIGEKCVSYLYSRKALDVISSNRNSRVIIMLRNPVDMVYSLHAQLCRDGTETVYNFQKALALEPLRARGKNIPKGCPAPFFLLYTYVGKYYIHVERYMRVLGDRVQIIIFDDLKSDPRREYRRVLEFLSVDPSFEPSFRSYNEYMAIKFPILHILTTYFVRRPPGLMLSLAKMMLPENLRARIKHKAIHWNLQPSAKPALQDEIRRELEDVFREDVLRLSELLDRDLVTLWLQT